ncbi:hypothetical protein [Photorhabdus namnaonensis]|uniref:2,3-dimethylmalate dehydratase small subunit n=1 Tax=Photorhabdus namnaonensis TaxID=1851568 RepID=A0A1B8YGF1_9GAMM|nr:hypothetical protein [Photorhabdus namnaonensis]OCA54117.1 2,3-dimethylmalate dehydratase small subunit [Photorhabdus namnaonensis]
MIDQKNDFVKRDSIKNQRVRMITGDISTDDIIPARYKHMYTESAQLAPHLFENRFPELVSTLQPGDIIVCNGIFGIGSSREQAVSTLLAVGIPMVVAPAFGRIFFRNAWNLGLLAIEADIEGFREGLVVECLINEGRFIAETSLADFYPPSEQMLAVVRAGGRLNYIFNQSPENPSLKEKEQRIV